MLEGITAWVILLHRVCSCVQVRSNFDLVLTGIPCFTLTRPLFLGG